MRKRVKEECTKNLLSGYPRNMGYVILDDFVTVGFFHQFFKEQSFSTHLCLLQDASVTSHLSRSIVHNHVYTRVEK